MSKGPGPSFRAQQRQKALASNKLVQYDGLFVVLALFCVVVGIGINAVLTRPKEKPESKKSTGKQKTMSKSEENELISKRRVFDFNWENVAENKALLAKRENTMKELLRFRGWKFSDVENVVTWDGINRDEDGWIDVNYSGLNLSGKNYSSVDGFALDLENAAFDVILTETPDGYCGLLNDQDLTDVLTLGITDSQFTLDQADVQTKKHPFQEMKYFPSSMKSTNYLNSLLYADYLLKMFAQGSEVSSKKPFLFRDIFDGFAKSLPEELQEKIIPVFLRDLEGHKVESLYRFWIEAGDIPYSTTFENGQIVITFGHCPMEIKCHRLKYDQNGTLVDDTSTFYDSNGPEAQFANDFTQVYDEVGRFLQIFPRLRELAKLGAIYKILRSIYAEKENSIYLEGYNVKYIDWRQLLATFSLHRICRFGEEYRGFQRTVGCSWVPSIFTLASLVETSGTAYVTYTQTRNISTYGGVSLKSNLVRANGRGARTTANNASRSGRSQRIGGSGSNGGRGGGSGSDGEGDGRPKKMNKNRKDYVGESLVYVLFPKNGLWRWGKVGITSRGEIRPTEQIRKLQRSTGEDYEYRIFKRFGTRREALDLERKIYTNSRSFDPDRYPLEKRVYLIPKKPAP